METSNTRFGKEQKQEAQGFGKEIKLGEKRNLEQIEESQDPTSKVPKHKHPKRSKPNNIPSSSSLPPPTTNAIQTTSNSSSENLCLLLRIEQYHSWKELEIWGKELKQNPPKDSTNKDLELKILHFSNILEKVRSLIKTKLKVRDSLYFFEFFPDISEEDKIELSKSYESLLGEHTTKWFKISSNILEKFSHPRYLEIWFVSNFKSEAFQFTFSTNPVRKSPILGGGCILYHIDLTGIYVLVMKHLEGLHRGKSFELVFGGYSDVEDESYLHTAAREVEEETGHFYDRSTILQTLQNDKEGVRVVLNKLYLDNTAWYATILTPVQERVDGNIMMKQVEHRFTRDPRAIIANPSLYWRECSGFEWRLVFKPGPSEKFDPILKDADIHLQKQGLFESEIYPFLRKRLEVVKQKLMSNEKK